MHLLIILQILAAWAYYATAPFVLTWDIWLMLVVNYSALWVAWRTGSDFSLPLFKRARLVFTISLVLLEGLIALTDSPVSTNELQGLANDVEVLVTGILLGVLWQDLFKKPRRKNDQG